MFLSFLIIVFSYFSFLEQFFYRSSKYLGEVGFFANIRDTLVLLAGGMMGLMDYLYKKYPKTHDPVKFYIAGKQSVLIRDASHANTIFSVKETDFEGFKLSLTRFRKLMGFNLITVQHPNVWKDLRHRTMPMMTGSLLNRYEQSMMNVMKQEMLPMWKQMEERFLPLDVWDNMLLYSSKVVFMAFMGLTSEEVPLDVHLLLNEMFGLFRILVLAVANLPEWVPYSAHYRFNQKMANVRRFVKPYIEKQKNANTMLGSIIRAHTRRLETPFDQLVEFLNSRYIIDDVNKLEETYKTSSTDIYRLSKNISSHLKDLNEESKEQNERQNSLERMCVDIESFLCKRGEIDTELVYQELISNLIGGSETTIVLMTFSCYFLASNPEVQKTLRQKLVEEKNNTLEEQINKGYLGRFLNEVLRLAPPGFITFRVFERDVLIGVSETDPGYNIEKGVVVWSSQYYMHRDPASWVNAEKFDPDRWLGRIVPASFFPFGIGPRQCPGNLYAKREAAISVSTLVENFQIEHYNSGYKLELDSAVTIRPKEHVKLRLTKI